MSGRPPKLPKHAQGSPVGAKSKPAHVVRPPDAAGRRASSNAKRRVQAEPAKSYCAGFFTALVRQHNWPPGFQAQVKWQEKRAADPEALRAGQGFDRNPLWLPGVVARQAVL